MWREKGKDKRGKASKEEPETSAVREITRAWRGRGCGGGGGGGGGGGKDQRGK